MDNHSHMLSGNHDNETTLRLLYYPPIIKDDDNKCEMSKGKCKYSQQKCNGNLELDLTPPKDLSRNGDDDDDEDDDEDVDAVDNKSDKSRKNSNDQVMTRCGAHCDYGTFTLLSQDSEGGLEVSL